MKKTLIIALSICTFSAHGAYLHIGNKKILLSPEKITSPTLAVATGDKTLYAPMMHSDKCKLCTIYNDTKYNIGNTILDYLYFDGLSYINLGIPASAELEFEIKAHMDNSVPNHDGCLLGARNNENGYEGQYLVWYTNYESYCDGAPHILPAFGYHDYAEICVPNVPQTIRWQDNIFSVNGTIIENVPPITETPTPNSLALGALALDQGVDSRNFQGRVYYARFWLNDELIMNLIPALDASDTPAFYDTVSRKFFYNSGTGSFKYNME